MWARTGGSALETRSSDIHDMKPHVPVVTSLLLAHTSGDTTAPEKLLPMIYQELRYLAGRLMRKERKNHSLDPTALVHEAYLRLVDADTVDWRGRAHFFALAVKAMQRILVEHARKQRTLKRCAAGRKVTLAGINLNKTTPVLDILALDEALEKLTRLNTRIAQVVKLRFFAGLSCKEVGHILSTTERTIKQDWSLARAWLLRELDA